MNRQNSYIVRFVTMQAKTEEGQRIESLQQEIEKVEGDICRKSHYTRQLEHMLLRLRSNQVIQMSSLQTNNASRKRDACRASPNCTSEVIRRDAVVR
jgi:TolA-binding protein